MGTLLDTTVFIQLERRLRRLPGQQALDHIATVLRTTLGEYEQVGIASITASELLHGVHRASSEHRAQREPFVEVILGAFPPLPFDLLCARAHARLWSDLATRGDDIGAHDRLVAATALATGWRIATANVKHFERVSGLTVVFLNPDQ